MKSFQSLAIFLTRPVYGPLLQWAAIFTTTKPAKRSAQCAKANFSPCKARPQVCIFQTWRTSYRRKSIKRFINSLAKRRAAPRIERLAIARPKSVEVTHRCARKPGRHHRAPDVVGLICRERGYFRGRTMEIAPPATSGPHLKENFGRER